MNDFYTYAYLREDKTPYYIGKGRNKRAYSKNRHRISVPPKDRILFLKKNLTEEEAFKHEIYMIYVFGRKDLGTGILRNLTNGGEGTSGCVINEKHKQILSFCNTGNKNPKAKKILLINISGEHYIVFGEFFNFCKSKNLPYDGIRKRIQRGSNKPTKCGWYCFDVTNSNDEEIEVLKSKFKLEYQNRFNSNLINIRIPSNAHIASKSINLVFNFIKEQIKSNHNNYKIVNGLKYVKITANELENSGVSSKTAFRAINVLKENKIIDIKKLNKSKLDHSNFYSLCSQS